MKKKILLEVLFILLLSLTPLLWFRPGEMMVGHDNVFPLNPEVFLKTRLFTWTQSEGMGLDQSLIMGTISTHIVDALPYLLGFSLPTTQKIVYVFWFFLIGLSVYLLASLINPQSRFFKFFVTIFYQFNFFILQGWWIGERTKFAAYIAMPLMLSVLLLVYRQKISPFKAAVLNSLVFFFFNPGSLFSLPLHGGFLVAGGLFILFFSTLDFLKHNFQATKRLLWTIFLTTVGFFLVNAYQFLPALSQLVSRYGAMLGQIGGLESLVAWAGIISAGASFTNLFRLQGIAEWYDNPQHPYAKYFLDNPWLIIISFIFPLLIFLSVILVKERGKRIYVLYFFLVYLVGMFFAAGTHPPLGFIYNFLVKTVPGFAVFRSPFYKFAPAIFIAAAFLCGFTLDFWKEKIEKRKVLALLFSGFCLILLLGYHFPYFRGEFFSWTTGFSTRLKVPEYVFNFGRWAEQEKKDDLRILAVPPLSEANNYDLYQWGYLSLFPLPRLLTGEPVVINDDMLGENERKLLRVAYDSLLEGNRQTFQKVASLLRLGHILVRQDFVSRQKWTEEADAQNYQAAIEKVFGFPKEKELGNWLVYQITDQIILPKAYGIQNPFVLTAPFSELERAFSIEEVNAERFIILDNANQPGGDLTAEDYLFARCLSCEIEKEKPGVNYPSPVFLPDSPLYFLVSTKEAYLRKKLNSGSKIYHEIGFSLKRLMEMGRMLKVAQKRDVDKVKSIDLYKDSLQKIEKAFFEISNPDEKFLVAERVNFYLQAKKSKLIVFYGENMTGLVKEEFESAMEDLNILVEKIKPYLFHNDYSANKLFSFSVPKEGEFRILLSKKEIGEFVDQKPGEISLKIDDAETIDKYEPGDDWLDFGPHFLTKGTHHLLITISPPPNLLSGPIISEKSLPTGPKNCFIYEIQNFSNESQYEVNILHKNTDFEDLFYFLKEKRGNEKEAGFFKMTSKMDLNLELKEKKDRFLLFPTREVKGIEVGICAEGLTEPAFRQVIKNIEVKRLITPLVLLKSTDKPEAEIVNIPVRQIDPTKYLLTVKDGSTPFVLVFLEKFNPGWKISPDIATAHFPVFGFANGWIIDKPGDYQLTLAYSPQKIFSIGKMISLASVILGMIFIFKLK